MTGKGTEKGIRLECDFAALGVEVAYFPLYPGDLEQRAAPDAAEYRRHRCPAAAIGAGGLIAGGPEFGSVPTIGFESKERSVSRR
jgi:hypothetical protein